METLPRELCHLARGARRLTQEFNQLLARQANLAVGGRAWRHRVALPRRADDARLVQVAASLTACALVEIARALAHFDELLDRVGREVARTAQGAREYRNLRRVLQGFEPA